MIPYILHVTVITTSCFLFYKLMLQKETFYQLNRWTLVGCLAVSFLLPLLPVPRAWSWRDKWSEPVATAPESKVRVQPVDHEQAGIAPATNNSKEALHRIAAATRFATSAASAHIKNRKRKPVPDIDQPETATVPAAIPSSAVVRGSQWTSPSIAGLQGSRESASTGTPVEKKEARTLATFFSGATLLLIVFYCYLLGVVIFAGNFLLQLAVLIFQSYFRPVIRDGRFRIVEVSGNRAPCSFGNTIFINPANYDWETYNQILIHEKIHVSGRHTLDILLAEMALVIQWFNPFVWLYRREVENNLEFLTDAHVLLHREVERSAYQLSLLRVSAPHLPFSITNNYNQSLLKRRIVMMNSKRSSLYTVWKYFFLIPVLTGLMCVLNKPAIALAETTKKMPLPAVFNFHPGHIVADTIKKPAKHALKVNRSIELQSRIALRSTVALERHKFALRPVQYAVSPTIRVAVRSAVDARVRVNAKRWKIRGMPAVDDTLLRDGSWYATSYGDKLSFELKAGDDDHYWSNTIRVDKSEINPFPGQGTVEFKLVREAGTMVFKGQFDGQEGFGHFHYTPDAAFFPALKALGVEDLEDRRQFAFFTMNIKKDYVDMVVHNGYPRISERDLLSFAAMHIDQAFIQLWHGANLTDMDASEPRTLIRLKAMHIDRAYIDDLKAAGYDHLSLREAESMKAQHIDGAYIRSVGRGPDNQLFSPRELMTYKAMHIDSNYLGELRKLGYGNLSMREVTSLYAQHVTPEFIRQMQELGYKDLSARDLVRLAAMHVTPEFVRGFHDLGYSDLNANHLSQLKAMNITPEYVREFSKIGFDHIPVNLLTSLKATGINAEYVSKMKSQGFVSKDLTKYIRLKNDFN
ncbi:MAG TPA: M56 family metallopeptidase [Puia sp.]|nr:M56 family metallopeptidase [Puia sp.]